MDSATLEVTREEVLERENARYRAALRVIQGQAAGLVVLAQTKTQPTLATGFELLAGVATDALEAA